MMYKAPTIPQEVLGYVEPVDLDALLGSDPFKLNRIFKDVMKKQVDKIDPVRSKFGKIEKEEVTLPDKRLCHGICEKVMPDSVSELLKAEFQNAGRS